MSIHPEGNFAGVVLDQARRAPQRLALSIPRRWSSRGIEVREEASFGELAGRAAALVRGLRRSGLRAGDRVVAIAPVSIDLYALVLALFASGMPAVLIDTGMGARRVRQALRIARARAIVSVDAFLRYRWLLPRFFRTRCYSMDSEGVGLRKFDSLHDGAARNGEPWIVPRHPDDTALITFTSGSTGAPKGADRTHGLATAQHRALGEQFPQTEGDRVMTCFPVVALHNLACGVSTILPAVDLRAPASVDPTLVVAQMKESGVTGLSAAPAFLLRLVSFMEERGERAESVGQVVVGGAPVPVELCRRIPLSFPRAAARVAYGSTEAEPITSVSTAEVCASPGEGYLVGRPASVSALALVTLRGLPAVLDERGVDPYRVPAGESGEILVSGPHVNRRYVDDPIATRENKCITPDGTVWHRTGDVGHLDGDGRLWLTGRRADLVPYHGSLVHPYPVEAAVDRLPGVRRSALLSGRTENGSAMVVEVDGVVPETDALAEVRRTLAERGLAELPVRIEAAIPMDGRHNSKIDRLTLRARLRLR